MRIYYIVANNGDGSSSVHFFDSKECIDYLTDEARGDDTYLDGNGGSWSFFDAPGGITIPYDKVRTMADILEREND